MSKHNDRLKILSGISEEIIDRATQMRAKLIEKSKKGFFSPKRVIALGSAAAVLLVAVFSYVLFLGKQIPVYTGMTIASENTAFAEMRYGNLGNSPALLYNGDIADIDLSDGGISVLSRETGKGHLETAASSDTQSSISAESANDLFYSKKGEDFYITVHIDNPKNYEILSFTLNGVKYSSYMFEKGSDMENLILKCNTGDADGVVEYTIDAIKYVDGTEIKDVILKGERTVKVGVCEEILPEVTCSRIEKNYTSISLDAKTSDYSNVFTYDTGSIYAVLKRGGKQISDKIEIKYGEKTTLKFDGLYASTDYTLVFYALIDIGDGEVSEHEITKKKLSTKEITEPRVYFEDCKTGRDYVGCTIKIEDPSKIIEVESVELWQKNDLIKTQNTIESCYFEGLEFLKPYSVKVTYSFDLLNGKGKQTKTVECKLATQSEGLDVSSDGYVVGISKDCKDKTVYINMPTQNMHYSTYMPRVKEIILGPDCTSFGGFNGFIYLEKVEFRCKIAEIPTNAFRECTALTDIKLPDSVTTIGSYAFAFCSALKEFTIPKNVTRIHSNAFENCGSLEKIHIPDSVTAISGSAFKECTSLTEVSGLRGITRISSYTFWGCAVLSKIELPEKLERIGEGAFGYCAFDLFFIPSTVKELGENIFAGDGNYGNGGLGYIPSILPYTDAESDGAEWDSWWHAMSDGNPVVYNVKRVERSGDFTYLILKNGDKVLAKYTGTAATVVIPDGVVEIAAFAFRNNGYVQKVVIPKSVTRIGEYAFDYCSNLDAYIPATVKTIDSYAFYGVYRVSAEVSKKPDGWAEWWTDRGEGELSWGVKA